MGSQSNQILDPTGENLVGNSFGKILRENSCGKLWVGNLVGSCGNLAEKVLMVCNVV